MPRRDGGAAREPAGRSAKSQLAGMSEDEAQALEELGEADLPDELSLEPQRPRRAPQEDEEAGSIRTPRRDNMVLRQVKACLDRARPDSVGVAVRVERGVVVLEGRVADDATRSRVLDLVSACSGVNLIRSRLRLVPR